MCAYLPHQDHKPRPEWVPYPRYAQLRKLYKAAVAQAQGNVASLRLARAGLDAARADLDRETQAARALKAVSVYVCMSMFVRA